MVNLKQYRSPKRLLPYVQAIVAGAAVLIFNVLAFVLMKLGLNLGEMISWEISLTLLLCLALVNAILFLFTENKNQYWRLSVFSFLGFIVFSIAIATIFSGIGLNESGSVKWIYLVFSFGYLVFISIAGMIRRIVEMAIKQDKRLRGEK